MGNSSIFTRLTLVLALISLLATTAIGQSSAKQKLEERAPISRADQMPVFPGCENENHELALRCSKIEVAHFIRDNIASPLFANDGFYDDTSHIYFEIAESGKIQNVKAFPKGNEQLDEAAIKAIKMLPTFIPGFHKGEACTVKYSIPVQSSAHCIRKK